MPTQIDVNKVKLFEFNNNAYTGDEVLRYLKEGEKFVDELASGLLEEGRQAFVEDIEQFIDKVFRNSSMRGSQMNRLSNGRVGPNRIKRAGVKGPYPSIDQPMRIDRLHGADPNGSTSDVFVQATDDNSYSIVVTNLVFNLLDQGRPAIVGPLMKFPAYDGKRLKRDSLSLSQGRVTVQKRWIVTRSVDKIEPHNFLKTIVETRRLKGSNWSKRMRRYQLAASKRLRDFPFELSFRFDDTLMSVEISSS